MNQGLKITIIEAAKLSNRDTFLIGKNDAYTIIKFGQHKERTKTIYNAGSKAVWTETFNFPLNDKMDFDICIEVWDEDKYTEDDLIGACAIPFEDVDDGKVLGKKWFDLYHGNKVSGKIHLDIESIR